MTHVPETFVHPAIDGLGGGLYSRDLEDGNELKIRDTLFQHNHAFWGGGLYKEPVFGPSPTNSILLVGCRFIQSRADRVTGGTARGGGAALDHGIGKIDIVNCEFTLNSCEADPGDLTGGGAGAGLHIGLPTAGDCYGSCASGCGVSECTDACIAVGTPCADMSCEQCETNTVLTNCVFRANIGRGGGGGAIRLRRKAAFNHCVLVANETDYIGGAAVQIAHKAFASFNSCIIRDNVSTNPDPITGLATQIMVTGGACFSLHSCNVEGLATPQPSTDCPHESDGSIDGDPLFVQAPDPGTDGWGAGDDDELGDLRLQPDSPCIDAGDDGLLPPDTGDIDDSSTTTEDLPLDLPYRPRSVDGECGGGNPVVDMGAYEYWCLGDLNNDCVVNSMDLAVLLGQWTSNFVFPCPPYVDMEGDLDRDCKVDGFDLAILLGLTWGSCPAAGQGEGAAAPGGGGEAASAGTPVGTGCGDDQALFQQWLDSGEMSAFWQWYECVLGPGGGGGPTQ